MKKARRALRCKAKAKSTGAQCRAYAVEGYAVCNKHGAGNPKKGKPGGRPCLSGIYSNRAPLTVPELLDDAMKDPALTNPLRNIARIQVILDRAHGLLQGEEAAFLAALEGGALEEGGAAKMRSRLLAWYRHMIVAHSKKVQAIRLYFNALEKKASGVGSDTVQATMLAVVRVLNEKVPDERLRNAIFAALDEALANVVMGLGGGT